MSDYTAEGAIPVEDASAPNPPTVDELMVAQERDEPEQAATRLGNDPSVTSIDDLPSGDPLPDEPFPEDALPEDALPDDLHPDDPLPDDPYPEGLDADGG